MNPDYLRAIPESWQNLSKVFTALGDTHRQRILLTFERNERLNVSQIVSVSTLSRPTVSHHLKILREAGILESEKIGKEVFFWVNKTYLQDVFERILRHIENTL